MGNTGIGKERNTQKRQEVLPKPDSIGILCVPDCSYNHAHSDDAGLEDMAFACVRRMLPHKQLAIVIVQLTIVISS